MKTQYTDLNRIVTAEMLQHLPTVVQRYMACTGVVGKPWINTVRLKQAGRFRMAADKPWMPLKAVQEYTTNPPGFVWNARLKIAGLPLMRAQDAYQAGHTHMIGKLAGLFTIFDASGEQADQGAMMRYLNEMVWFPIAFLGDNITFQTIDDHATDVTFTNLGKSVSGRMFFDDDGRVTNFVAQRYREYQGSYSLDTWETPMTAYGMLGGLSLPTHGYASWRLPSGDLKYVELDITEIEYNMK